MRFALVNNIRIEAQPQLQGLCSCCSQPLLQNAEQKRFGIGHIKAKYHVIIGGNQKQNGTELGKTIIQPIGKRQFC
jgi:hypothetical protein